MTPEPLLYLLSTGITGGYHHAWLESETATGIQPSEHADPWLYSHIIICPRDVL